MRKFLAAAFHITLFQLLFILSLAGLKNALQVSGLSGSMLLPVIGIAGVAFVFLSLAAGIEGHIENQGYSVEAWLEARPESKKRVWIGRLICWGKALPIAIVYGICLYILIPTSVTLLAASFGGIILRNLIDYISSMKKLQSNASNR